MSDNDSSRWWANFLLGVTRVLGVTGEAVGRRSERNVPTVETALQSAFDQIEQSSETGRG